jgi:threonine/homoserine/homoserine lactone efflux protein
MTDFSPLLGVIAALAVGVISPGPSFVMVARQAVSTTRAQGLMAALGMGLGGVVFAAAALAGLQALLLAVPALYLALKVLGGLYLVWLGWRIWAGARTPLAVADAGAAAVHAPGRALALGLATQLSNPKTAVIYASVFAAFLPAAPSWAFSGLLLLAVFAVETLWYALVALVLSSARPRAAYLRGKTWVDRVAGAVMAGLGLKLVLSARG